MNYHNRRSAARWLVAILRDLPPSARILLGLGGSGVALGWEIVRQMPMVLDVMVVHDLVVPGTRLTFGAVGPAPGWWLDDGVIARSGLPRDELLAIAHDTIARRDIEEASYREVRERVPLDGCDVLVVADAIEHAAPLRAATIAANAAGARSVTLVAPVGSDAACAELEQETDRLLCPIRPRRFDDPRGYYDHLPPISKREVRRLLVAARQLMTPSAQAQGRPLPTEEVGR